MRVSELIKAIGDTVRAGYGDDAALGFCIGARLISSGIERNGARGVFDSGRELLADIEAHQARVAHLEAVEKAARAYVGAYCKAVYGNNTDPSPVCAAEWNACLLYTSPSPRDGATSRMPSSA